MSGISMRATASSQGNTWNVNGAMLPMAAIAQKKTASVPRVRRVTAVILESIA